MAGQLSVRRGRGPRKFRLHKPRWVDPFPSIPGTEPEKRIFEALVLRRIFFVFQGQVEELKRGLFVTLSIPGYKPDFVLPEYKVIIDPFSPFHHSLPGAAERDREKVALYTALGYTYYHPWAVAPGLFLLDQSRLRLVDGKVKNLGDLRGHAVSTQELLSSIPELHGPKRGKLTKRQRKLVPYPGYELGPFVGAGANSVAAANRSRTKPKPISLSAGTRRTRRRAPRRS